jgi:hypothetical protein
MKTLKILGLAAIITVAFAGCADKAPTTGDFMRMHAADEKQMGQEQKTLAKEWDRGLKLKKAGEKRVENGEALIKSGDRDMTKGKQDIEQGNKDIIEGTNISMGSEREFKEKFPELKLELK